MRSLLILCICLFIPFEDCFAQKPLLKTPGGAKYRIVSSVDGRKIELNYVITVNFEMLTQEGKVLYSSYINGDRYTVQVHESEVLEDLMEVFINLHDKDSAIVFIPTDSLYKNNEAGRPGYLPQRSSLVFHLKIVKVQTLEEALAEEKSAFENEREHLRKFLKDNKLSPKVTTSGLLYHVSKAGDGIKPVDGDTVFINYVTSSIGGDIFDTNLERVAEKAGIKITGRRYKPISFIVGETGVITPWDEAIMLLGEGSKAKFIIPSFLAFGAGGLGKIVKPYTTFVIDLEIIRVGKLFAKSQAEIHNRIKKSGKGSGLTYLPSQLTNKFSSFLVLLDNQHAKNRGALGTKSSSLWYLVWWDAVAKLFN